MSILFRLSSLIDSLSLLAAWIRRQHHRVRRDDFGTFVDSAVDVISFLTGQGINFQRTQQGDLQINYNSGLGNIAAGPYSSQNILIGPSGFVHKNSSGIGFLGNHLYEDGKEAGFQLKNGQLDLIDRKETGVPLLGTVAVNNDRNFDLSNIAKLDLRPNKVASLLLDTFLGRK